MENNTTLIKLEKILKDRNWTLYRLAKEADLPYSSVANLFNRNTEPTLPTLRSICKGLGISLSEFFSDDPIPPHMDFTVEERDLVIEFRQMNKTSKKLLMTYAAGLNRKLPKSE